MKPGTHYANTSIWYREVITDPYAVMDAFFSAGSLAWHKQCITTALEAASSSKIYSRHNPGDLLYEFGLIESLINATWLISNEKNKKARPAKKSAAASRQQQHNKEEAHWNNHPRLLSLQEFAAPHLVFRQFFKAADLNDWKQQLQLLADHALVNHSLFEAGIEVNMLSLYFHLTKLVEAAHLINSIQQ